MSLSLSPLRARWAMLLVFTLCLGGLLAIDTPRDQPRTSTLAITDSDPRRAVTNVRYTFIDGQPVGVDDDRKTQLCRRCRQRLGAQ